jgi:hypothetical protein
MAYIDRLVYQYQRSSKLIALLMAMVDTPTATALVVLNQLRLRLSIDDMEGRQLDEIGAIVGLGRPPSLGDEATYFETVFTYSDDDDVFVSDPPRGYGGGEYVQPMEFPAMADPDYRQFLKAKIIRNNSNRTLWDCQQVAKLLLGDDGTVTEYGAGGIPQVTFTGTRPANPAFVNTLKAVAPVAGGVPIVYVDAGA